MKPAFEVKSARLDALCIQLNSTDPTQIIPQLKERAEQYRELGLPFFLDLLNAQENEQKNIVKIIEAFRKNKLPLTALRHNHPSWASFAREHQLAFSETIKSEETKIAESAVLTPTPATISENPPATPTESHTPENKSHQTVFISTPVRTGQQVYAENADLIVTGMVSEGAEILADGHIHIYGIMRGRVQAGVSGKRDARIFIQSMQAELVSIAGIYRNFEQDLPAHLHKQPVQIYLQEDDRLVISALGDIK